MDQLVSYLMAKNPGVRYQDLGTVIEQISPFIDPARLNPPVTSPIASLPTYEAALQTKQTAAQVSPTPAVNPAAAANPTPAVNPAPTVNPTPTVSPRRVQSAAQ